MCRIEIFCVRVGVSPRGPHSGLVHASGGALHGRVSGGSGSRPRALEICRQPELRDRGLPRPVRAHGVDAAILFADILLLLELDGRTVRVREGRRTGRS